MGRPWPCGVTCGEEQAAGSRGLCWAFPPGNECHPSPTVGTSGAAECLQIASVRACGFSGGERFIQSPSLQSWLLFAASCKNIFLGPTSQRSDVRLLLRELLGRKGAIPHSPAAQGVRAPVTAGTPVRTICRGGRSGWLCPHGGWAPGSY